MRKLAALVLALAFPSLALASGYALPNTNPRDLGVSASAVAAQNDSGGAFALPASLARLSGPSARLSAGGVVLASDWTDPTGAAPDASIDTQLSPIGSVSAAFGGKLAALGDRGWGVGIGVEPFGGSIVSWPEDWAGRYRIVEVDRKVFSGVLTAGIEVIPRVRIGGGLVYYYTTEELTQHAWMVPFTSPINPAQPDAIGSIDASGGALSYDVSAEVQPLPDLPLTVAIDYKHKATQTLDGDVKWQNLAPGALALLQAGNPLAAIFADQGASQELTIPNVLNVGVAYRVTKPLLVMATYTFDRWIVYDRDVFKGDNGATISVQRNYSNGWTLRGGAEYDLAPAWTVRGGLQYDHSGLDPKYYSPTLPDATTWAGSLGATWRFSPGFALDAAVFYAWFDEVTSEDPNPATPGTGLEPGIYPPPTGVVPAPEGTFRGTYNTNAFIFSLGVAWTPGAK
ncbi:MAG TPA: outer membrane protein transport protein [Anaeromyxobacter sp.]|nr:outer membrane protein transport protein [Anaeromyxobacter sp.]